MKRCPITYEELKNQEGYSVKGLQSFSPKLKFLKDFPYSAEELRREAFFRSSKLSIQGVQPKLSVNLSVKNEVFEIVDTDGRYILKPQVESYPNLPENEDLTMKLAAVVGIETPLHGLIRCKDGTFSYVIKRFDRKGQKEKVHTEDFAQLSGANRDTKYESSMEQVAKIIEQFCTFPLIEKKKFFERTLFSFLTGNEDMHLKNYSIIVRGEKVELSPAYDLVNSTLALGDAKEEIALPIRGKKSHLKREDFIDYFALQRLELTERICHQILEKFCIVFPVWRRLIDQSFLPPEKKLKYLKMIESRTERLYGVGK